MNTNITTTTTTPPLAPQEFATLGLNIVAYIRPATIDGHKVFIVHAADGTQITALAGTYEQVFATIRQNDIEPVWVH